MSMVSFIRDKLSQVFNPDQADVLSHVIVEAHDALATRADIHELRDVVKELAEAQRHTDQTVAGLAEAQRSTDKSMAKLADSHRELAALQRAMLIRLDNFDDRMLEMCLRTHLPAYIGKHVRRCRIVEVQDVIEELEPLIATGTLAEADVDEFRRTDLLATGMLDGETIYLVGEVSRTGDNDDIYRAARRADVLKRAGKKAMPIVACDLNGNAALELARREGVNVLQGGSFLQAAG